MLLNFTQEYLEDCINLFYEVFSNPPWNYQWLLWDDAKVYINDLIDSPKSQSYIYLSDGQLCGACFGVLSSCSPIPIYEIREIFVRITLQNKGIGTHMLQLIEDDLKTIGIAAIKLNTLRSIPAFHFYCKNNFVELNDSVHMVKILNP